ncbi:Regulator of RpoS [Pseudomonas fluorescens]|uniref:Regulator of RpoS n=2 Tax=Pseudomonas fluorescens TaxID=294 RepID=A0A5E7AWD9_PSEFL|nr:Regulator of RpoS [Pseudomonas fluorescens]
MRVMILDDDPWIAELLKQLVLSLRPLAQVECFGNVTDALQAWHPSTYQMVIADWNLPDASGVSLLQTIREQDRETPLIMITGRSDRDSVLTVRPLGISAFFTKPFQVSRVLECLKTLLPPDAPVQLPPVIDQSLIDYLSGLSSDELDLPLLAQVKERLQLGYGGEPMDIRELVQDWQHDPALCARLIAVANSALYNDVGQPCTSLIDAIKRLGELTSVNLALSQALRQANTQTNKLLMTRMQSYLDNAERLADQVASLARLCNLDPLPLQSAALLHRIGEFCVLFQTQKWENRGNSVGEEVLSHALRDFSAPFAINLKACWGLPLALRELIGAIYALPPMQVHREQVVMRLGAAMNNGEPAADLERLQRMAGLA